MNPGSAGFPLDPRGGFGSEPADSGSDTVTKPTKHYRPRQISLTGEISKGLPRRA